jgi:hypothetical protein
VDWSVFAELGIDLCSLQRPQGRLRKRKSLQGQEGYEGISWVLSV